jgi:hypothetical protein
VCGIRKRQRAAACHGRVGWSVLAGSGFKTTATAAAHDVGRGAEADEVAEQRNSLCRAGRAAVIDPKRLEVLGLQLRHLGNDGLRIKRQRDRGPCDATLTWALSPLLDDSRSAALAVVAKVFLVKTSSTRYWSASKMYTSTI